MNRRTWIASVGASLLLARLHPAGDRVRDTGPPRPLVIASRLEVEATLFRPVSSSGDPDLHARAADGVARSVDFSNDAVWSELVTEAFATAARTTPFHPEVVTGAAGSAEEPRLPAVIVVLRYLAAHPDQQLVVACPAGSQARALAVVALLEGDRAGFVRATARYQTASSDAAILAFAARTRGWPCAPADRARPTADELAAFQAAYNAELGGRIRVDGRAGDPARAAYFDLFEAEATERAGTSGALATLRGSLSDRELARHILVVPDEGRSELVELRFLDP